MDTIENSLLMKLIEIAYERDLTVQVFLFFKKGTAVGRKVCDQYSNLRLKLSLFPRGNNAKLLRMSENWRVATTRGINNKVTTLV